MSGALLGLSGEFLSFGEKKDASFSSVSSPIPESEIRVSANLLNVSQPTSPTIPPTSNRHKQILQKLQQLRKETSSSSLFDGGEKNTPILEENFSKEEELFSLHLRIQNSLNDLLSSLLVFKSGVTLSSSSSSSSSFSPSSPSLPSSSSSSLNQQKEIIQTFTIDCINEPLLRLPLSFTLVSPPLPSSSSLSSPSSPSPSSSVLIQEDGPSSLLSPSPLSPSSSSSSSLSLDVSFGHVKYRFNPLPFCGSNDFQSSFTELVMEVHRRIPDSLFKKSSLSVSLSSLLPIFGQHLKSDIIDIKEMFFLCGSLYFERGGKEIGREDPPLIHVTGENLTVLSELNIPSLSPQEEEIDKYITSNIKLFPPPLESLSSSSSSSSPLSPPLSHSLSFSHWPSLSHCTSSFLSSCEEGGNEFVVRFKNKLSELTLAVHAASSTDGDSYDSRRRSLSPTPAGKNLRSVKKVLLSGTENCCRRDLAIAFGTQFVASFTRRRSNKMKRNSSSSSGKVLGSVFSEFQSPLSFPSSSSSLSQPSSPFSSSSSSSLFENPPLQITPHFSPLAPLQNLHPSLSFPPLPLSFPSLPLLFWFDASSELSLICSMSKIANKIQIPKESLSSSFSSSSLSSSSSCFGSERMRALLLLKWLGECQMSWVLVYDNAEDVEMVSKWLVRNGEGCIILISSRSSWDGSASVVRVQEKIDHKIGEKMIRFGELNEKEREEKREREGEEEKERKEEENGVVFGDLFDGVEVIYRHLFRLPKEGRVSLLCQLQGNEKGKSDSKNNTLKVVVQHILQLHIPLLVPFLNFLSAISDGEIETIVLEKWFHFDSKRQKKEDYFEDLFEILTLLYSYGFIFIIFPNGEEKLTLKNIQFVSIILENHIRNLIRSSQELQIWTQSLSSSFHILSLFWSSLSSPSSPSLSSSSLSLTSLLPSFICVFNKIAALPNSLFQQSPSLPSSSSSLSLSSSSLSSSSPLYQEITSLIQNLTKNLSLFLGVSSSLLHSLSLPLSSSLLLKKFFAWHDDWMDRSILSQKGVTKNIAGIVRDFGGISFFVFMGRVAHLYCVGLGMEGGKESETILQFYCTKVLIKKMKNCWDDISSYLGERYETGRVLEHILRQVECSYARFLHFHWDTEKALQKIYKATDSAPSFEEEEENIEEEREEGEEKDIYAFGVLASLSLADFLWDKGRESDALYNYEKAVKSSQSLRKYLQSSLSSSSSLQSGIALSHLRVADQRPEDALSLSLFQKKNSSFSSSLSLSEHVSASRTKTEDSQCYLRSGIIYLRMERFEAATRKLFKSLGLFLKEREEREGKEREEGEREGREREKRDSLFVGENCVNEFFGMRDFLFFESFGISMLWRFVHVPDQLIDFSNALKMMIDIFMEDWKVDAHISHRLSSFSLSFPPQFCSFSSSLTSSSDAKIEQFGEICFFLGFSNLAEGKKTEALSFFSRSFYIFIQISQDCSSSLFGNLRAIKALRYVGLCCEFLGKIDHAFHYYKKALFLLDSLSLSLNLEGEEESLSYYLEGGFLLRAERALLLSLLCFVSVRMHRYQDAIASVAFLTDLIQEREERVRIHNSKTLDHEFAEEREQEIEQKIERAEKKKKSSLIRKSFSEIIPTSPRRPIRHPLDVGALGVVYDVHGHILSLSTKYVEAESFYRRGMEIRRSAKLEINLGSGFEMFAPLNLETSTARKTSLSLLPSYCFIGMALRKQEKLKEAFEYYERVFSASAIQVLSKPEKGKKEKKKKQKGEREEREGKKVAESESHTIILKEREGKERGREREGPSSSSSSSSSSSLLRGRKKTEESSFNDLSQLLAEGGREEEEELRNSSNPSLPSSSLSLSETEEDRLKYTARVLTEVGELFLMREQYQNSILFFEQALAIQVRVLGTGSHATISHLYRLMGSALSPQEMWEESLDRYKDALAVEEEINVDPQNWVVTITSYEIGVTALLLGHWASWHANDIEASYYYQYGMHFLLKSYQLGRLLGKTERSPFMAKMKCRVAELLHRFQSEKCCLYVRKVVFGFGKEIVWQDEEEVSCEMPRLQCAFHLLRHSLWTFVDLYEGSANFPVTEVLRNTGDVLVDDGKRDLGLHCYTQTRDILHRLYGPEHYFVARILQRIGGIMLGQRKLDEAMNYFTMALAIFRLSSPSDEHRDIATTIKYTGDTRKLMRQFKDSIDCYKKARNIWRKMGNGRDDCDEIASLYVEISDAQCLMGKYASALTSIEKALQIRIQLFPPNHPRVNDALVEKNIIQDLQPPCFDYFLNICSAVRRK